MAQLTSTAGSGPSGASAREVGNIGEGVLEGGKAFARGLISGAVGVLSKPVEGIERAGVSGFFEGVTKVGRVRECADALYNWRRARRAL
jgi:hypothetical protein